VSVIRVGLKINKQETIYSTFLTGCCLPYCTCCLLCCLVYIYIYISFKVRVCIVVSWIACMVIAVLCILWSPYVYLLCGVFVVRCICCAAYLLYSVLCICCAVGIDVFTLDAGLLARSQYPEGPATGHLVTGFSWSKSKC
jgi:hypothetical protein